jgi:hypothetical protein
MISNALLGRVLSQKLFQLSQRQITQKMRKARDNIAGGALLLTDAGIGFRSS